MLRSWTRHFSTAPKLRAGIAIGRSQVSAVVLDAQGGSRDIRRAYQVELSEALFSGQPTAEVEAQLVEALQAVGEEFRASYAAVHVALPDTVIRSTVFEFDELPKTVALREALLRWRFAKEWQRPEENLECRGADLGEDNGKRLFFGQAADRSWTDCVQRALSRAEIVPWSFNAAASYRFNRFHDVVAQGEGALVALDPDCWNLLLWDGGGRIRRVITRLRASDGGHHELQAIAGEAERAILAHVQSGGKVAKVYLAGSDAEVAALSWVLDGRLHGASVVLQVDEGVSGNVAGIRKGWAPLALAAALST